MSRRHFLMSCASAAVSSAVLGLSNTSNSPKPRKPNIIFILADDLGYGDLGCYGQRMIKTPYLDRMAREGVRFTQCYAGSTVCAPSRCALMVGQHTGHCTIRGNALVPLRTDDITVAQILHDAGYTTALIGKWGLGEPGTTGTPNKKGFDYFFGYLNQKHAHDYYTDHLWRNEELVRIPPGTYSHDLFTKEALEWIRANADRPFFLYLAYTIPHANNEMGNEGMQVPSDYPYSNEPWPQPQKNHAAMITRMDRDIGRLMNLLWELGIDNDTVVFFSSDNGPHREGGGDPNFFDSNGPLRGIKRDLYEGGIRVPMIVRWPGTVKAGRVSDQVWAFWDFLPTAAEIAGTKPPTGIDGISMLPAILGAKQKNHEYLYWEFHERGFSQAVRFGDWKAVRLDKDKPIEIYDLKSDIGETRDLAENRPDLVRKAEQIMESARTPSEHWPGK
ncbi:MAG: arylsulfatase [Armatimonadota bacterium]|nr:arylsulfatase [Armatimonadota bacterium]